MEKSNIRIRLEKKEEHQKVENLVKRRTLVSYSRADVIFR